MDEALAIMELESGGAQRRISRALDKIQHREGCRSGELYLSQADHWD